MSLTPLRLSLSLRCRQTDRDSRLRLTTTAAAPARCYQMRKRATGGANIHLFWLKTHPRRAEPNRFTDPNFSLAPPAGLHPARARILPPPPVRTFSQQRVSVFWSGAAGPTESREERGRAGQLQEVEAPRPNMAPLLWRLWRSAAAAAATSYCSHFLLLPECWAGPALFPSGVDGRQDG